LRDHEVPWSRNPHVRKTNPEKLENQV
jgi:hypothetical protein